VTAVVDRRPATTSPMAGRPAAAAARRLLPVAVAAGAAGLLLAAPWLVDGYTLYTAARVLGIGLLAVSVAVLTGTAGLPTLGQVAPYAVGAYTTGVLARAGLAVGPVLVLLAALAAAGFSVLVGLAVVRTRGVVFLMVTLAVGELTAIGAEQWRSVTGGTDGLGRVPAAVPWPGGPPLVGDRELYWYALVVAAVAVAAVAIVLRSPAGALVRGCRDNETRMRTSGHRVTGYLLATYTGAGALAGVGGALLVTTQRYVSPADVGFQVSALVLLAVIIGGATSIWGALAAAGLVVAVRDWAAAGVPGHGPLLLGVLFVVAVFVLPRGVAGAVPELAGRLVALRARSRKEGPE
jgi:branched-chain amino acid transport system permease protein